jgi:hypothetical protein
VFLRSLSRGSANSKGGSANSQGELREIAIGIRGEEPSRQGVFASAAAMGGGECFVQLGIWFW